MPNSNFSADISAWVRRAGDKADAFCRIFCGEVSERVKIRTPFETGAARAGWQPSINGNIIGDANSIRMAAAQVKAGDTFALTNNVAYIRRLEYGWSQQAPNGMVRITVAEADEIAQQTLARVQQMD